MGPKLGPFPTDDIVDVACMGYGVWGMVFMYCTTFHYTSSLAREPAGRR
jgi:hypothetical protein